MLNKKERMAKLNSAGIEVGKYFTFEVPEGLEPGTKIHLVVDESGVTQFAPNAENDTILSQIIEDGYVRNTKLHRRFVMAQMFQMLNYVSYDGYYRGYNDCLKKMYSYDYTFNMMLEEVRVLSKLEVRDVETFKERSHFFTKDVVIETMRDYLEKLKKYIDAMPNKNCKGVPYKRIKGVNIFVADLDKKIYMPIRNYIYKVGGAGSYGQIYKVLSNFIRDMVRLPWDTPKSKAWIDAYKGAGAFYTMKNLLMFHDCYVEDDNGDCIYGTSAVNFISSKLDEYKGEYYRMFALMKKVIEENNFDFKKRMAEIYGK